MARDVLISEKAGSVESSGLLADTRRSGGWQGRDVQRGGHFRAGNTHKAVVVA